MKQSLSLKIRGAVQGVGFRPFVYQLATELGLTGWVRNSSEGVAIAIEGEPKVLETFILLLSQKKPPLALIEDIQATWDDAVGYSEFQIKASTIGTKINATMLITPNVYCEEDAL